MDAITRPDALHKIRDLNDAFRRTFVGGVVLVTQGIQNLSPDVTAEVLQRVRAFDKFTADNDPHGEHDFGSFDIAGQVFFWKLDYYERDSDMQSGSPDPSDPEVMTRVLTVTLAEEY
jgi:hypothetical protein